MEVVYFYLTQIFSMKAIKAWFSLIVATFSYLIWGIDVAVKACIMLVFLDFLLGFTIACYKGQFSWKRMMQWLIKFILYWIAMIVGNQIDLLIFHDSVDFWVKNLIVLYIGINDWISVLKHLWRTGLKLPQKLIERLQWIQDNLDIDINKRP